MNALRNAREEAGLSQTDLAAKVCVSARHIAFIESGERKPSIALAFKIAKALEKQVEEIFLPDRCTEST